MATCTVDISQLYRTLNNPYATSIVRSGYGSPAGPPPERDMPSAWSIKVFLGDDAYQLGWFYDPETMRITSTYGEKGSASFGIVDDYEPYQVIPFRLEDALELRVQIWNLSETYCYFDGFLADADPEVIGVRADGTEAVRYQVSCKDLYGELERESVNKLYTSKKHGFILRDVLWNYTTLDPSDIDPNLGFLVDSYPIKSKRPSQILEHIANLTDTTYIIEPVTRKIKLVSKTDAAVRFNLTVNETNKYDLFDKDSFKIRRQNDLVHNVIEFWYRPRYTAGTVNVSQGTNIVAGHGSPPATDWEGLLPPMQFKLANSSAVYTAEKNNSSGATQEWRLSSNYAESTSGGAGTNQPYELRSDEPSPVYVTDQMSIGLYRALRKDSGRFVYKVSSDENYFTYAEAKRFAGAMLAMARPLPQGQATTYTSVWSWQPLLAGMVLPFDLPTTKRYVGDVVVQQIVIEDEGGTVDAELNQYGQVHPYCKIRLSFDATLSKWQAQFRKLMLEAQKVKINLDDTLNKISVQVPELLVMKDCVHPSEPISISELLSLDDPLYARIETEGPLFYSQQSYSLNRFDYAFSTV